MKDRNTLFLCRRIMAIVLCAFISFAYIPFTGMAETNAYAYGDKPEKVATAKAVETKAVPISEIADNDELLMEYLQKGVKERTEKVSLLGRLKLKLKSRKTNLPEIQQGIYDELKPQISEVAAGNSDKAEFSVDTADIFDQIEFTEEDLGTPIVENGGITDAAVEALYEKFEYDAALIIRSLMADMPYELYWFDKTIGYFYGLGEIAAYANNGVITLKVEKINFHFTVSKDYSPTNVEGETAVDTEKTSRAADFIENTSEIIETYSDLSDAQKMEAYRREICKATDYDHDAFYDGEAQTYYGDPWQIISIFDGDKGTKVVCEGYSKAFQFLCDNSDLSEGVEVYTVYGMMSGGTGEGPHMWNIAHMDNGKNYLVDVTCSDISSIGFPDKLFLKKPLAGGSVTDGYTFDCDEDGDEDISYTYAQDLFTIFNEAELRLDTQDYEYESVPEEDSVYIDYMSFGDRSILKGAEDEYVYLSDIRVFVESEYGELEYEQPISNVSVVGQWDAEGNEAAGIVNLVRKESDGSGEDEEAGQTYWEITGAEFGSAEIEYTYIDYYGEPVTESFIVYVTDEYCEFDIDQNRYHVRPGQSEEFSIYDIRKIYLDDAGEKQVQDLTDEQVQGLSAEWFFADEEDAEYATLSELSGLSGKITFAENDDPDFERYITLFGRLKDSGGKELGESAVYWHVANQFDTEDFEIQGEERPLYNDGDLNISAYSDYFDFNNLDEGYSLEFTVGEYEGDEDEGYTGNITNTYEAGTHYTVDGGELTLHGDVLYEAGARNIVVLATLKWEGTTIRESNALTYTIREAGDFIDYPTDIEAVPGQGFPVNGFSFTTENTENPYERAGQCKIKNIEIVDNENNAIKVAENNPYQDDDEDTYYFEAIALGQATLKVTFDMYFVERNGETDEVTEELYKENQECEIQVNVVNDYYSVTIFAEKQQNRPGTSIDLYAKAEHIVSGEGIMYADDVEYVWTITKGEEFASLAQDANEPHKAKLSFSEDAEDTYVFDEIEVTVSLKKDNKSLAEDTMPLYRCSYMTEINVEPNPSPDMAVGDTVNITAEVRDYPSEEEGKEYDVKENVRFVWETNNDVVEITDSEGTVLGEIYNEETGNWEYIETENTTGSSCEFTIKRLKGESGYCTLFAFWEEGENELQTSMEFNFTDLDEGNYSIEFSEGSYEVSCGGELALTPTLTGFDYIDYNTICKVGVWDDENKNWEIELSDEAYSYDEETQTITLSGPAILEEEISGVDVWLGAVKDGEIIASGLTYVSVSDHVWNEGEVTTDATEEAPGEMTYSCTVCGATKTERIDPLPHTHNIIPVDAQEPSCTEAGNKAHYICTICDKLFSDKAGSTEITAESVVVDAKGHTPAEAVEENVIGATCTSDGSYDEVVYCSKCNSELSRTEHTTTKLGHNWGDWIEVDSPNCTDKGSKKHTCSRCNIEEFEDVNANGHTWADDYTVDSEASCTAEGSESIHCTVCGVSNPETVRAIAKKEHTFGDWVTKTPATCETAGSEERKCSVCEFVETQSIDPLDHDWTAWTRVDENEHSRTCKNDSSHVQTEAHTWNEGTITEEASCTKTGTKEIACTKCGETKTETLNMLAHDPEHHPAVPATYAKAGNYEYWQCKTCDKFFSDAECTDEMSEAETVDPQKNGETLLNEINGKVQDAEEKAATAKADADTASGLVNDLTNLANLAKEAAEKAAQSLKNEDIAAAEQAVLDAKAKQEAAKNALDKAKASKEAADNAVNAARDAIVAANQEELNTGDALDKTNAAGTETEGAGTSNSNSESTKTSADGVVSAADATTKQASQDRTALEGSIEGKVTAAESAADAAEATAKAAEDAVEAMKLAAEVAEEAADKAAQTKNAQDIADARAKANEAKAAQAAAKKAIEDAEAAKAAADTAAEDAETTIEKAEKAVIDTGDASDKITAAKAKTSAAAGKTGTAKSAKDALDAAVGAADNKVSGLEKEQKDAADAARRAEEAKRNGIIDPSLPKVSIKGPKKAKKSFTSKWKKLSKKNQKKVQGIEIQVAADPGFTQGVILKTAKKSKTSLKVKGLRSKGTYWVHVRSYKWVGGTKYVSYWSKTKKVKLK